MPEQQAKVPAAKADQQASGFQPKAPLHSEAGLFSCLETDSDLSGNLSDQRPITLPHGHRGEA